MKYKYFFEFIIMSLSLYLVYYGQRKISLSNLIIMLIGVLGILLVIYIYNNDKK